MKGRKLLMIPGPIEFEPAVMRAMGAPTTSHVAPAFIESFGRSLEMMRQVWMAPSGQPFIIAGTGTLAMDVAGANLTEPGDRVLVVSTGYFGERYADLLKRYGAEVSVLRAPAGDTVDPGRIEDVLKGGGYKLMTFTHVDTSTAVRVDPEPIGRLGRKYGVLTILDGVCSVAGERILQEEWGIDIALTASQKAIGVPPGLALLVASARAMEAWKKRKTPVANYYADWANWLPIMEAYEQRRPSYFGTPAVNLVAALEVSLGMVLKEGMDARFIRHERIAGAFRSALKAMGLGMIPNGEALAANTLSAPRYPAGVDAPSFLKAMSATDVIIAGGLLPDLKNEYFRVGHMGSVNAGDLAATVTAIETALTKCGHKYNRGSGVAAAMQAL
ncbi:MAG: alanine--glyoxylate aminotransferase family protein [Bacteroidales bacterium]|jgi:alanine-glyoxylate transaminase/serine-glyoxylate transaminase/serine-pyruvate transaminase|nr:alanine--glyoxylate aminotransferase family protein [Bacteroidales bacterium]